MHHLFSCQESRTPARAMRSAAFILLACLLSVDVKGMAISPRGRCQCTDAGVNFIHPKEIEKIEVYSPSSSCERMEIIVTLKESAEQRCLNPESIICSEFHQECTEEKQETGVKCVLKQHLSFTKSFSKYSKRRY